MLLVELQSLKSFGGGKMEKSHFRELNGKELGRVLNRPKGYIDQCHLEIARLQGWIDLSHINFLSKYFNMIIIFHS